MFNPLFNLLGAVNLSRAIGAGESRQTHFDIIAHSPLAALSLQLNERLAVLAVCFALVASVVASAGSISRG